MKQQGEKQATDEGAGAETAVEQPGADEQSPTIQAFDAKADSEFVLHASQMACDMRDVMLDLLKTMPKTWQLLKEDEQRDIAAGVQRFSEGLVNTVVMLLAAKGQEVITAKLEQFTYKDGAAKVVLKAIGHEALTSDLAKLDGKAVLVVSADASPFYGMTAPDILPDQPGMFSEAEPGAQGEESEQEPVELGDE